MKRPTIQTPTAEPLRPIKRRAAKVTVSIVYCAYGDESRDEAGSRVYAVAGVFGSHGDWDALEGPWKDRLGGRVFHAADCEFGHGEFAGLEPGECRDMYRDVTQLVVKSKLMGVATAINVSDFNKSFPEEDPHAPYIWGFGDVVENMAHLATYAMPSDTVKVVFDRNQDIQHSAREIYNFLVQSNRLPIAVSQYLADEVAFECRKTIGIQVADLIAREAMKNLDNEVSSSRRPTRLSFVALRDTTRFNFVAQGKHYFEERKAKHAAEQIPNATLKACKQWFAENGLIDNLTNHIAHLKQFPHLWENK